MYNDRTECYSLLSLLVDRGLVVTLVPDDRIQTAFGAQLLSSNAYKKADAAPVVHLTQLIIHVMMRATASAALWDL